LTLLGRGSDTTWSAAFADGQALLGRADGSVQLRDMGSSRLLRTLSAGEGRVWSLAAGPHLAAAACGDGRVRLWALDGPWTMQLNEDEQRTWSVALSEDGTRLAAASGDGIARVWELPSGRKLWEHRAHAGRIRSMALDRDGSLLLTGGGDGVARLWRLPDGEQVTEFAHGASWVRAVALDPSGARVALGCGPGDIYVHGISSNGEDAELHGHTGRVLMAGFTAEPDVLVSAAADGTVRTWSLPEQKQLAEVRVDPSLQTAALDPATGAVLAASASGTMAIGIPVVSSGR
jgi:WD40 repeat protein